MLIHLLTKSGVFGSIEKQKCAKSGAPGPQALDQWFSNRPPDPPLDVLGAELEQKS